MSSLHSDCRLLHLTPFSPLNEAYILLSAALSNENYQHGFLYISFIPFLHPSSLSLCSAKSPSDALKIYTSS